MIRISVSDECDGCGVCAKECPTEVLEVVNKKSSVKNIEMCMACKYCEVVCPLKGISVVKG